MSKSARKRNLALGSGLKRRTGSFPIKALVATSMLTIVLFSVLAWQAWSSYRYLKVTQTRDSRLLELGGIIVHLDEVLTMSARMGAATGEGYWEQRYRQFAPLLDAAIKEASDLVPEIFMKEATAQTDAANTKLVEMELQGFDLVRAGRSKQAKAILFSEEYEKQKEVYARGMEGVRLAMQNRAEVALQSRYRWEFLEVVCVGIALPVLMLVWTGVIRSVRRHIVERNEAEQLLGEARGELEQRVAERTAQLERANQELRREIRQRQQAEQQARQAREEAEQSNRELACKAKELEAARVAALNMVDDLERLRDAAEESNRLKSEFLANMSHEIRTPMNGILGFCELLSGEELSEEQHEHVRIIQRSGLALLTIIDDILDLSKIEAGELGLEQIEFSLPSLLAEVGSLARPGALEKGLDFEISCPDSVPNLVLGDPTRLRQILLNLTSNAVKFTEHGHVHVLVSAEESAGKISLRFDVQDSGMGIASERQQVIFEAFRQADGSTTRTHGGTGLGLTISQRLARAMGGELSVSSEPGVGSTFSLSIPVEVAKDQKQEGRYEGDEAAEGQESSPVVLCGRVLLAEDDPATTKLIRAILKPTGVQLECVADGKAALDKAGSEQFGLLLLDMQMPKLDGYSVVRALRGRLITTTVVALTARAMKEDREKCIQAGCDDYLAKPFSPEKLLAKVAEHLGANIGVEA